MAKERESLIGQTMSIVGEVACKGRVVLEGRVEGSFTGKNLVIGETGQFLGQGTGESIECAGRIEGHIRTISFRLLKTGHYVGKVETRDLMVEPGAVLDSDLQSGSPVWREYAPDWAHDKGDPPLAMVELHNAFNGKERACCMDVPWSERLDMFSHLLKLLDRGKPLIKITGTEGSGKSVLVEKLCDCLPETYQIVQIKNQVGSVSDLLQEIASGLGLRGAHTSDSPAECMEQLRPILNSRIRAGNRVVVIVDDAHKMYPATLEGITRLLTNGYGEGETMALVVLLGTGDLESKMVPTMTEYFEDETNCQLVLEPLNIKDTTDYLRFSLQLAAGGDGVACMSILPQETIQAIHLRSQGNIAAINRLANAAIRKASGAGAAVITPQMIS
ncbi:MAG: AAA family ATPase [Desulforhopalus sp.]